ncbi:hypothetical protein CLOM_g18533 [Closterium sp. NIES-68]|nr:hypothetical protein CLOM_g18533 [Closterium sp. NIES-68]GJP64310.1 hypothetical protein CLOP_g21320 [Closterium sp. NIES-67]
MMDEVSKLPKMGAEPGAALLRRAVKKKDEPWLGSLSSQISPPITCTRLGGVGGGGEEKTRIGGAKGRTMSPGWARSPTRSPPTSCAPGCEGGGVGEGSWTKGQRSQPILYHP